MSTKLDRIMEQAMNALHECNLWSPLREIRSAGSKPIWARLLP